ncbi:MAG TPA: peptide chain release factor N(5)-glutamine methyltransferase [Pseudomonadales bacterium]|nr:peptide chain release factor N(5)-glutamine methyltransferase [Pseudomonadales bacterium]
MKYPAADTIADHLRRAEDELRDASEDPRRDAEVLLGAVLNCDRAYFFAYSDEVIDDTTRDLFCHYIARRKEGEPVAYIIGKREFWSLLLSVNDSTLIPRPDTEMLVETALQRCIKEQATVLDLGTGTGAIALALASEKPDWHIEAIDVQIDAVALATLNMNNLALNNVHIYQSRWFAEVRANTRVSDARFDLIISNPPYIAATDPHLARGDVRFEPHSALIAEDDGYADLFAIAEQARDFLCDTGLLLLEHGFEQADKMRNYLRQLGYVDVQTVPDYGGNERVVVARWQSNRQ